MKTMVAAVALSLLAGCTQGQLSKTPTVFVDSSFSPEQVEAIEQGYRGWEAVTDFRFHIILADHTMVRTAANEYLAPNVIFVMNDANDVCPNDAHHSPTGGVTDTKPNGSSFTCISSRRVGWRHSRPTRPVTRFCSPTWSRTIRS